MSVIVKRDTNGVKPLLQVGELGYDNYPADGDILYVKPNNAGALTNVVPTDTEIKVPIATVIKAHTNGSIFVRLTPIDENHSKAGLATKAKLTQLVALAQALGLSQAQINAILAL